MSLTHRGCVSNIWSMMFAGAVLRVLAERKGPKLGLIVSPGYEATLYADDPADTATVIPSLLRPEHVTSLADTAGRGEKVEVPDDLSASITDELRGAYFGLCGEIVDAGLVGQSPHPTRAPHPGTGLSDPCLSAGHGGFRREIAVGRCSGGGWNRRSR